MPHADPERRREWDRERKRLSRAAERARPPVSAPEDLRADALRETFDATQSCSCPDCRECCPRCRVLTRRCLRRRLGLLKP